MSPLGKKLIALMESEKLIKAIEADINHEQTELKTSIVDDILRTKRLLAGWEFTEHAHVLTQPGAEYDHLMELEIEQLEVICATLYATASRHAQKLHGLRGNGKND